jgi:hypothetical protein
VRGGEDCKEWALEHTFKKRDFQTKYELSPTPSGFMQYNGLATAQDQLLI